MWRIISSTEDAAVSMTTKIKNMKLTDFEDEDVIKVTGQLKMALKHLQVLNKIPEDPEKNIITILQTISVANFNNYFKQLGISLNQIPSFTMTYKELLTCTSTQYREMLQTGVWRSVPTKIRVLSLKSKGDPDSGVES